jgi:uncharacterized protein YceH (UPF0502 family)
MSWDSGQGSDRAMADAAWSKAHNAEEALSKLRDRIEKLEASIEAIKRHLDEYHGIIL